MKIRVRADTASFSRLKANLRGKGITFALIPDHGEATFTLDLGEEHYTQAKAVINLTNGVSLLRS